MSSVELVAGWVFQCFDERQEARPKKEGNSEIVSHVICWADSIEQSTGVSHFRI